jgi:hypothetical protein
MQLQRKIKRISRINISDKYKIVLNSPKALFDIRRTHAEVEHKNLFSFSYKNHLDRFIINTKKFI